jgi:CRP-like cAMP-binding protein
LAHACNHLIELLPPQERLNVLSRCEQVPLVMSEVLGRTGQPTCHAYFPIDGFISQVAQLDGRLALEVGMVGREGLLGAQLALGVAQEPLHAIVQCPGHAWRMAADDFCALLKDSQALLAGVNRYLSVLMAQRTGLAACHRFHTIGPRLARWLLMTQNRSDASSFHVTHQDLAFLLGVRRVGITTAAGRLQSAGLITYHRGQVTVLDRRGLAAVACSCYAADCQAYAALMS